MNGYIKLHRKILDNGVFSNAELLKVFIWCLIKANHNKTPKKVYGVKLNQGQFITGRASACEELNIKPSTVYNRLLRLQEYGYIKLESTNKYTVVSVSNYSKYQVGQSVPKIPFDERLQQFKQEVWSEFENRQIDYKDTMVADFTAYWTEPNKSKTKMRFEMQKTFSIPLRLKKWYDNSQKFNNNNGNKVQQQLDNWQQAREMITNERTQNLE